jgi:hypothetical protein
MSFVVGPWSEALEPEKQLEYTRDDIDMVYLGTCRHIRWENHPEEHKPKKAAVGPDPTTIIRRYCGCGSFDKAPGSNLECSDDSTNPTSTHTSISFFRKQRPEIVESRDNVDEVLLVQTEEPVI